MGCANSMEQSELLKLHMLAPIQRDLHVHALQTVRRLLKLVAVELGLKAEHGAMLELVFCDHVVEDHATTLDAVGMRQEATFEVKGVEKAERAQAEKSDPFKAAKGDVRTLRLLGQYAPEKINKKDNVSIGVLTET